MFNFDPPTVSPPSNSELSFLHQRLPIYLCCVGMLSNYDRPTAGATFIISSSTFNRHTIHLRGHLAQSHPPGPVVLRQGWGLPLITKLGKNHKKSSADILNHSRDVHLHHFTAPRGATIMRVHIHVPSLLTPSPLPTSMMTQPISVPPPHASHPTAPPKRGNSVTTLPSP